MTARKRAVGTREHIVAYLAEVHELFDAHGMASTQLAAAVGYPGSSVAFAQLLSGMERSGLIRRDVRGKRTYRISLSDAVLGDDDAENAATGTAGQGYDQAINGAAGFDYDELARRLLVQLVRRLAAAEPADTTQPEASEPHPSVLQATVTGLEYELASAWMKQGELGGILKELGYTENQVTCSVSFVLWRYTKPCWSCDRCLNSNQIEYM